MAAAFSSSDAEAKFFFAEKIGVEAQKPTAFFEKMRSTHSTYYLGACISESETKINKNTRPVKDANNLTLLESYKHLADNWNGYGAGKFNPEFIDKVKDIVLNLEYSPKIFPTGRNSIQLEYNNKNGYIEIEIYEDGLITFLHEFNGGEEEGELSLDKLNDKLSKFYAA